jgi:rhodanese-related sulfurtransferase
MGARIVAIIALAGFTAIAALACTKQISDRDIQLVDLTDARELVEGRKRLFGLAGTAAGAFVDPRSARLYRQGHIPGAIHLPFQDVSTRSDVLSRYDVLVVYGDAYDDELAMGMSKRLMELGFRDVRTLRGGLKAWTAAGFELVSGNS